MAVPAGVADLNRQASPPARTKSTSTVTPSVPHVPFGDALLRHHGRLHHIGLGRRHAGRTIARLIAGRNIRILSDDGQLLHQLVLDPTQDYQPQP